MGCGGRFISPAFFSCSMSRIIQFYIQSVGLASSLINQSCLIPRISPPSQMHFMLSLRQIRKVQSFSINIWQPSPCIYGPVLPPAAAVMKRRQPIELFSTLLCPFLHLLSTLVPKQISPLAIEKIPFSHARSRFDLPTGRESCREEGDRRS